MRIAYILVIAATMLCTSTALADRAGSCSDYTEDVTVSSGEATAGIFSNLFNLRNSLKFESVGMLRRALDQAESEKLQPPAGLCPSHCRVPDKPEYMLFSSVPGQFLGEYRHYRKCQKLLDATEAAPLIYTVSIPDGVEALTEWIGEFSRGEGSAGADLYRRCDGACSPQYHYLISQSGGEHFEVQAEVICGHARDKDDNLYKISYGFRWVCR